MSSDQSLTACRCQGFIHKLVLDDAGHDGDVVVVDCQVACDVVEMGVWVGCCQGPH